jgi:hypothetical protein
MRHALIAVLHLTVLYLAVLHITTTAYGHIIVDAVEEQPTAKMQEDLRAMISSQLTAGLYEGLVWDVARDGKTMATALTAANVKALSAKGVTTIVDTLAREVEVLVRHYRVTVDTEAEDLSGEEILPRLSIDPAMLEGVLPAEDLLSPYAQEWAYRRSQRNGPNCWHTSIASVFPSWTNHRYMDDSEFSCHIEHSFTRLADATPGDLQFGDLIRLYRGNGEVHGFTYLGTARDNPTRHIVFTKNGYAQSYYLYMDLATVQNQIYPGNRVGYYRPHRVPTDPSEDETSECYDAYLKRLALPQKAEPLVLRAYELLKHKPVVH